MNHAALEGLPMVLETPIDRKDPATGKKIEDKRVWADEIKLLEGLVGADPDGDEFLARERELHARGADEREKVQDQVDRKAAKGAKKSQKGKGAKGRRKKKGDETESEEHECDSGSE